MDQYQNLITWLRQMCPPKEPLIVAIDGRCGSGKTTLAGRLAQELDATVFHMDDFFLRAEQRTPERLAAPGEFVDHERFRQEILQPIREKSPVILRRFSHATFQPGPGEEVLIQPIVIVEGSYSFHPDLIGFYDYKIFLNVDPKTQLQRIARRDPDKLHLFIDQWIPREEMYFTSLKVSEKADRILTCG